MTVIWDSPAGQQAVQERYRAFLGHWPVPSEQLRIPTRQGETFAVACGPPQAPPPLASDAYAGWLDDVLDSRQTARRLRRLLPEADVVLLPGSGHLLLGQAQRIGQFLIAGKPGSDA